MDILAIPEHRACIIIDLATLVISKRGAGLASPDMIRSILTSLITEGEASRSWFAIECQYRTIAQAAEQTVRPTTRQIKDLLNRLQAHPEEAVLS